MRPSVVVVWCMMCAVCALEFSAFVGGKITYWPSIPPQYTNVVMYAVFTFMDVGGSAWCILNMPTRHLTRRTCDMQMHCAAWATDYYFFGGREPCG